jgi:hypothetical protein
MSATIVPFPERRPLGAPSAQHGKPETAYAFVQRMVLNASLCIEKGQPIAAAIFLETAARRLQPEAIKRSSTSTRQEVSMADQNTSSDDTALIAMCEEWHRLDPQATAAFGATDEEGFAAASRLDDRCWSICKKISRTPPRTLKGFAAQCAVVRAELARMNTTDGKLDFSDPAVEVVYRVLGHVEQLAKGGTG